MSTDTAIKRLEKIINNNTEKPRLNDKRWQIKGKSKYKIMKGRKRYVVDDNLVTKMDKYSELYMEIPGADMFNIVKIESPNIAIIYIAKVFRKKDYYIGHTMHSLLTFIKLNIHKKNIREVNVYDNFPGIDITDIRFQILEFINFKYKRDIAERERYYKELHKQDKKPIKKEDSPHISKEDRLYEKRVEIFYEVFNIYKDLFKPFKGNIYELRCSVNDKKFIGGIKKKITLIDFLKTIYEDNEELYEDLKKYPLKKFSLRLLEEYEAYSPFDLMLRIDYNKLNNNTIERGYNKSLCMEVSSKIFKNRIQTKAKELAKKKFFIHIQRYLFRRDYVDDNDYTDVEGYIYQIKHKQDNKRYFNYVYGKKIKEVVLEIYEKALHGNLRYDKIATAFSEEPYDIFDINIIKKKLVGDTNIDIFKGVEGLKRKYDTVNTGYNS